MSYYAVAVGRIPGIYTTWNECKIQIDKFSGAKHKKFKTRQDAENFISGISNVSIPKPSQNYTIHNQIQTQNILDPMNRIVIWTDGACKNNGINKEVGGIGVFFADNDMRNISQKISGNVTNNRAELFAAIYAIHASLKYGYKNIEIRTDSMYIKRGITEWIQGWKARNYTNVKNDDLWKVLDQYSQGIDIKWTHVSAHVGIHGNEMADYLANACL